MKNAILLVLLLLFLLTLSVPSDADFPKLINYQGVLTQSDGKTPVEDGSYHLTFKIYGSESGDDSLWTEHHPNTTVTNGLFNVILGSITSLDLPFDAPYWLGIQVGSDPELAPRAQLTSVGYAYRSQQADTAKYAYHVSTIDGVTGGEIMGDLFVADNTSTETLRIRSDELTVGTDANARLAIRSPDHTGAWLEAKSIRVSGDSYYPVEPPPGDVFVANKTTTEALQIRSGELTVGNDPNPRLAVESPDRTGAWLEVKSIRVSGDQYTNGEPPSGDLLVEGQTTTSVLAITGGSDLAEPFQMSNSELIPEGALVVIDDRNPGRLKMSDVPYDRRVAGIVSGAGGINPGLTLSQEDLNDDGQNVALSGQVYALATASNGAIRPGDMLTTSNIPGHAMKAMDKERWDGAIIGKAMTGLQKDNGLILVLVNLQ